MSHGTFLPPDLTTFCRLDGLGLQAVGQRVGRERAVLECRVIEPDEWCRSCGAQGLTRRTATRRLAHEPFGWRPTTLLVRVRRYRRTGCGDRTLPGPPRGGAKVSRAGLRWALEGIVCQHRTVARIAAETGRVLAHREHRGPGRWSPVLISDPSRFEGVKVIGVDEHAWRRTRRGDK